MKASEMIYEDVMFWAKAIVNKLFDWRSNGWYNVVITLDPNPSQFKGMDHVTIEIVVGEDYQHMSNPDIVASADGINFQECIEKLNRDIEKMVNPIMPNESEIVFVGGKKYKLVEVK